jgi:hypothetical protein
MKIPEGILKNEPAQVQGMFEYWSNYMEQHVEFWPVEGQFDIHTQDHSYRVLLLALKIGWARELKLRSMIALCQASIFHDTRRKDNYLDQGHGDRAADYYRQYCQEEGLKYLPEVFAAIKFHDRDDQLGTEYIQREAPQHSLASAEDRHANDDTPGWLEVYRDFKDADALDRLRLGPWALDENYLRSPEAKALMPFAQSLVEATIEPNLLHGMMEATRPYFKKDNS